MTPRDRLLKQFRELVGVRLEKINAPSWSWSPAADVETGRKALRELHGLKGEARMMGFDEHQHARPRDGGARSLQRARPATCCPTARPTRCSSPRTR